MADKVLTHPTVAEVIAALSEYPQDAKFTMEDADTGWTISIIRVDAYPDRVEFSGSYTDMERE